MGDLTQDNAVLLLEIIEYCVFYVQYQLLEDLKWALFEYVGPILVSLLALQGLLALLRTVYKIIFPPDAPELHRSALAALHHHKRVRRDDRVHQRQAEQLLLKTIARDDLYFPAYMSLAALYIYQLREPQKAVPILDKAKDRGPLAQVEPLRSDAQALLEGGNDNMLLAGGSIFAEHQYLSVIPDRHEEWETDKETYRQHVLQKQKQQSANPKQKVA